MNLIELIVCTECKTRVEYHDGPDGYMSCECWIRSHRDEPMPEKWLEIEDMKANPCGVCRQDINERLVFRCADCGLPFHQICLDQHCKHGNQKQELRSEKLFLERELIDLRISVKELGDIAEAYEKNTDKLESRLSLAEAVVEAARKLLLDSEYFTRGRCSDVGQEYGKGTDAEDATRAALRALDAGKKWG